jgi:RHS repeat-associated protein
LETQRRWDILQTTGNIPSVPRFPETDTAGNTQNEYVFFSGKRVALLPAGSTAQYYVEDSLGSSRVITSNTGVVCYDADFYPFGGERPVTDTCTQNSYKFEGKERDVETGNDDFGARYYSNRFGRWLSADWSSVPAPVPYANLTNPQTLNLYSMVSDDPESFADLDGHCWPPSACADVIDSYVQVFRQDGMAVNDHTSPAVAAINTFANGVTADLASGAADVLRLGNGLAAAIDSAKQGDYLGAASNLSQDGGRVGQVILGVTAVAASASPAVNAQEVAQKAGPGNTSPETPAGRVDLTGDSHYSKAAGKDIDTPHVHENASNTNPATGQTYNFQQKVPRPATNADVNAAAKAANVRITPKPVPIKPKPPEQQ